MVGAAVGAAVIDTGAEVAGGAVEGMGLQVLDNELHGRDWSDDLGQAAAFGAATAGVSSLGGRALARV